MILEKKKMVFPEDRQDLVLVGKELVKQLKRLKPLNCLKDRNFLKEQESKELWKAKLLVQKESLKRNKKPKSISKNGKGEEIEITGEIKTFATPAPMKRIPSPKRSIQEISS